MKFETLAIRLQTSLTQQREHSTPMFPTSSFVFDDAEQMRAVFADEQTGNMYSRFTNPNCKELEDKMAALGREREITDNLLKQLQQLEEYFKSPQPTVVNPESSRTILDKPALIKSDTQVRDK